MAKEVVSPRLAQLERTIEGGLRTFLEVGEALMEIRDSLLYRETHATFKAYCEQRWGFSDSRARQLIGAAQTVTTVTARGLPAPQTEREARRIARELRDAEQPPLTPRARDLLTKARTFLDRAEEADDAARRELLAAIDLAEQAGDEETLAQAREVLARLTLPLWQLEQHPLVRDRLPDIEGEQWTSFAASISRHGLIQPIVVYEGKILDGWQRYRACAETGAEPRFTEYHGDEPFAYWWGANLVRKHHTKAERASMEAIAALYDSEREGNNG